MSPTTQARRPSPPCTPYFRPGSLRWALLIVSGTLLLGCQQTPAPVRPTGAPALPTQAPTFTAAAPTQMPAYPGETTPPAGGMPAYPAAGQTPGAATIVAPTAAPTATRAPFPQSIAPVPPTGRFKTVWDELGGESSPLGLATSRAVTIDGADQVFEKGCALWVGIYPPRIYVLYGAETSLQTSNTCEELSPDQATWQGYVDTYQESEPAASPVLTPPANLQQPMRGFGKVWSQNPEVKSSLGWAKLKEQGSPAEFQLFEHGVMVWTTNMVRVFVLYEDGEHAGRWQSFQSPP